MSSYWAKKAQSYNTSGKQTRNYNSWRKPGTSSSSTPATPPPPLGPLLKSLRVNDLDDDPDNQHSATIQDCELVSSYNWLDTPLSEPNILIPGKPPLWSPPPTPPQLREDSGLYHRDRNSARYPLHPLEPAILTLLQSSKPSLVPSLDIVACSSTLGNLLRFCRGQDKTFRILVEKVGQTVFFVRRENSPTETIPDVRGYGHAFPEAYTVWEREVKGSGSHQRVVKYRFGGLGVGVRFEADGYINDESNPSSPGEKTGGSEGDGGEEGKVEDLFASLKVSPSDTTTTSQADAKGSEGEEEEPKLTIKNTPNDLIPQSQIFDLKTRSIRARGVKDTLSEELPRLWISQIPKFILAYHTRGLFKKEDMEIKDVREDVQRWEKEQKVVLGKLVGLLKWIREVVAEVEGGKMELVHREEEVGVLEVRRQGWPEEEEEEEVGEDGDEDVKKETGKTVRGDRVMSEAIRAQWVEAQKGGGDEQPKQHEDGDETEKGENVVTTEKAKENDGDTDGKNNVDDDGWISVYSRNATRPSGTTTYSPAAATGASNRLLRENLLNYFQYRDNDYRGWESDDGAGDDFTACSLEDCGYCGRCRY
ncbi:hypothetical protein B0T20DRAFT_508034 [Sordaria brevicollis]|uniref:Geranylgeranyl pyrophosphate synthetase n=1 Tax=Sordaria brevicollis TaxID=83679 RepID=A0AAE0UAP3_SORBR|nr:hypothetical protein B0T20DRAFT_508034 [Sordaria brevicollis]